MLPLGDKARPWVIALAGFGWLAFSLWLYARDYPHSPYILPFIPLGCIALLLAVRYFEGFLMTMVFLVPMSVSLTDVGGGLGVALPGEMMLLMAAMGILAMLMRGQLAIKPLLTHPLGIVIVLQVVWSLISALASTHPPTSWKFFISHGTYILVYFIGFGSLTMRNALIVNFFKAYLWGLLPVMVYAIINLSQFGLSRHYSPVMADPFYDDHTLFGACIAMVLPMAAWIALHDKMQWRLTGGFNWAWPIFLVVLATLFLTFSRAAWMSLGVLGGMYAVLRLRIRLRYLVLALLLVAGSAWLERDAIVTRMEQNDNISGDDVLTTAASVTNLNSDDSNKERLNRWACAIRMFEQRPWLGFGPGTYERKYGDFQLLKQMTRISTWIGDRGDAHSEYLGVLAEQGIPGLIFLSGLFLLSIGIGMRVIYHTTDPTKRGIATAIVLGLSTYYFHGFVNDFLDIDKAAVLFWGMLGMLTALDQRLEQPMSSDARGLGE
jgi:putative inorganic carbon (hco3(-)) transporter